MNNTAKKLMILTALLMMGSAAQAGAGRAAAPKQTPAEPVRDARTGGPTSTNRPSSQRDDVISAEEKLQKLIGSESPALSREQSKGVFTNFTNTVRKTKFSNNDLKSELLDFFPTRVLQASLSKENAILLEKILAIGGNPIIMESARYQDLLRKLLVDSQNKDTGKFDLNEGLNKLDRQALINCQL
jgi:hypothetical protein